VALFYPPTRILLLQAALPKKLDFLALGLWHEAITVIALKPVAESVEDCFLGQNLARFGLIDRRIRRHVRCHDTCGFFPNGLAV
jgi:hypothetical protein